MQIQNETGTCVLVGAINRAILWPEWLVKCNLVQDGETQTEFMLTSGPVLYRYSIGGFQWTIDSGKLVVEGVSEDANPGEMVARVIDTLKHTPVHAVGNNFRFAPDAEAGQRLHDRSRSRLSRDLGERYASGDVSTTVFVAPHEDSKLSVSFESNGATIIGVLANFHRDVADADQAAQAARRWQADRDAASRLLEHLRGMLS